MPSVDDIKTLVEALILLKQSIENIKISKNLSLNEKIQKINFLLIETYCSDLGQQMLSYNINLTIAGDFNDLSCNIKYDEFAKQIEKNIKIFLENTPEKDLPKILDEFFPKTNFLNSQKTLKFSEKFIHTIIPKEFRKEILENLQKSIDL